MKRKISFILMSIAIVVLDMCFIEYVKWDLDNKHQEKIMEHYQDVFIESPKNEEEDLHFLSADFEELKLQNSDVVGWIQVPGTLIDYPIVQTHDNEFYLSHSFDKSESMAGWIFSDFRNNLEYLNRNSVIYGHRRNDDSLFGSLRYTLEEDWLSEPDNFFVYLSTPHVNYIFQVFSVYVIPQESYYITTHFPNDEAYQEFLNVIQERSIYPFDTLLSIQDKILTLSTCKDGEGIDRVVLHAKLIKKETR